METATPSRESAAPTAKDIEIRPISRAAADRVVRAIHYSGSVVRNSQIHLGVLLGGRLLGAMQFGPSLDKRRVRGLVEGTRWNGFLELNRMAFHDDLPRNSESRALGVALRMLRKRYPHVEWVVSFADGTQCGDGTIYRAAGFVLTQIKENKTIWRAPDGSAQTDLSLRLSLSAGRTVNSVTKTKGKAVKTTGAATMRPFIDAGYKPIPGFQLRYVYFLNPAARERLTCPVIPFSKIDELGAGMYRGEARAK